MAHVDVKPDMAGKRVTAKKAKITAAPSRHHRQNSIFQGAILRDNHDQRPAIKRSKQPTHVESPPESSSTDNTRKRKAEDDDELAAGSKKKTKTNVKRNGKNGVRLALKWESQLADGDTGNYWYLGKDEFDELSPERQGHWTHVGRLLFAGDGVQPIVRCTRCEKHSIECIVYSKAALELADNLPKRCAGCLSQNRSGCKPIVGDETEEEIKDEVTDKVKQEVIDDVEETVTQDVEVVQDKVQDKG